MHPLPKLGWTMIFSPKSPEVQLLTIKLKALWNEGTTFIGVASSRRLWVCKCPICWQVSGSGHFFSISHCWPMKPSWHLHVPVRAVVGVVVLVLGCKHCILAFKSNLACKYNFLHHQHIHRCHRSFNDLGPGMGQSPCPLQHIAAEQSTPPHPKKQMHWPRGNQQRHWGVYGDGSDTNIQKLGHLLPINYSMTRFLRFPILVAWKCPASVKVPFYIILYPVVMWYILELRNLELNVSLTSLWPVSLKHSKFLGQSNLHRLRLIQYPTRKRVENICIENIKITCFHSHIQVLEGFAGSAMWSEILYLTWLALIHRYLPCLIETKVENTVPASSACSLSIATAWAMVFTGKTCVICGTAAGAI